MDFTALKEKGPKKKVDNFVENKFFTGNHNFSPKTAIICRKLADIQKNTQECHIQAL